jgi:trk system potassium uptake protein TrkA
VGTTLRELDIRSRFNVSVIAINRGGDIIISPSPDVVIRENDVMVVIGENSDLKRFADFKVPALV